MSTLAVITDNEFNNEMLLYKSLKECTTSRIILCGLTFTDILLREFAKENNIPVISFSKELNNLDMSYDFIRNRAVIDQSDILIVLWDGKNTFIKQSIDYAKKQKKDLRIFHYSPA